jgi:hypothetical protein
MGLKKVKTIAKAFIEPLPEGEDWYEDRLKACGDCEYNIKNIEKSKHTLADKLKISAGLCDNENHCQACGCCIERKCATKSEDCGLVKLGLAPKWTALELPSVINKGISLINLSPTLGKITVEPRAFIYTVEGIKDKKITLKVLLKRDNNRLEVKHHRPSCSCISVDDMSRVDRHTYEFIISVSTTGFREGLNERGLYITYYDRGGKTNEVKIDFKLHMSDGK